MKPILPLEKSPNIYDWTLFWDLKKTDENNSAASRCILVQFEWYEHPKNVPKKVLNTFSIYIS